MTVMNGPEAEVRVGNCLPLSEIPVGTQIHNIELYPGKGGQLVRSAGNSAQLMARTVVVKARQVSAARVRVHRGASLRLVLRHVRRTKHPTS